MRTKPVTAYTLFGLDAGEPGELRGTLDRTDYELPEFCRRVADGVNAETRESLLHHGVRQRCLNLCVYLRDDGCGCRGRREYAIPARVHVHTFHAGLQHRGHVRQKRRTPRTVIRERTHAPGFHLSN